MKKFISIFSIVAVALLTAVSCQKEKEIHVPGEPDVDGCYGVYFPTSQEAAGDHIFNPTQEKEISVTAARKVTTGSITVPVEITASKEGVFEVGTLTFADGQSEASMLIKFPNAEEGTKYSLNLYIKDHQYASIYAETNPSIDLSVMCVEMQYFTNSKGEKAKIHWDQGWWGESVDGYIKFYEVNGVRTCFTECIPDSHYYNGAYYEGEGFWGVGNEWTFYWYTKTNYIRIPNINTGYHNSSYDADVYVFDYYTWDTDGDDDAEFLNYAANEKGPVSYYDGNGGFYFCVRSYYMFGVGGWNPGEYDTVGIAEGFVRVDYTLELESDFSEGGVAPLFITAGPDVESVKYQVYEGELNGAQIDAKVEELKEGAAANVVKDELVLDEEDNMKYAVLGLEPEKSGNYTVVAIAVDAEGKAQNSASVGFKCITAEDEAEYVVDVNVFVEDTPARYTSLHAYDSFAYGIYGSDLTEVHMGVFTEANVTKYGLEYLGDVVKGDAKNYGLSAAAVSQINAAGGLYDVLSGLSAKTTYYVIVWATNGNLDAFAADVYTTDKLPYVWNSLGEGSLTDGFYNNLFGLPVLTVPCEVYEETNTPGLYLITGFQKHLIEPILDPEEDGPVEDYENVLWKNAEVVVDATNPAAVYIEEQEWGICLDEGYGWMLIDTDPVGTLTDGVITFPTKTMYVGLPGLGKWYYGNTTGEFQIVLPGAAAAPAAVPAVKAANISKVKISNYVELREEMQPVVYERDAQPAKNVKVTVSSEHRQVSRERVFKALDDLR